MAWSLPSDAICAAAYEGHTLTHDATSAVEGRHRAGEKSPPDSGDLRGYLTECRQARPGPDWAKVDFPTADFWYLRNGKVEVFDCHIAFTTLFAQLGILPDYASAVAASAPKR